MKIQTYTTVVGTMACNARCAFCIAKQTPDEGLVSNKVAPRYDRLHIGAMVSQANGVTTALITSKGEPTLFPDELKMHVCILGEYFPLVEMQTNGLLINERWDEWEDHLNEMQTFGLTTVAISIVSIDPEVNDKIYTPHRENVYQDLPGLIEKLHSIGLSVRLTLMMFNGGFDDPLDVEDLMNFALVNKVEQTTIRPIVATQYSEDLNVAQWTRDHLLTTEQLDAIVDHVKRTGTLVMTLPHGAEVYDYDGVNLCLTDCLTIKPDTDDLRQLIFFPDGSLRYDWQYKGARIL